jgi:hypothetical protein
MRRSNGAKKGEEGDELLISRGSAAERDMCK